jgi:uncharacterized damage-inducible protein DinB
MRIADFLPEFDEETRNTRRMLERVPDEKLSWKPHPKSGTMGWLATHVAELPGWTVETFTRDSLDIAPPGPAPTPPRPADSTQELLDRFDAKVQAARAALAGATDDDLQKPWTLLSGGKPVFTMPRGTVFRSFVMSHMIHHRAHLGLYLRLNDVAVPGVYGPSADEM